MPSGLGRRRADGHPQSSTPTGAARRRRDHQVRLLDHLQPRNTKPGHTDGTTLSQGSRDRDQRPRALNLPRSDAHRLRPQRLPLDLGNGLRHRPGRSALRRRQCIRARAPHHLHGTTARRTPRAALLRRRRTPDRRRTDLPRHRPAGQRALRRQPRHRGADRPNPPRSIRCHPVAVLDHHRTRRHHLLGIQPQPLHPSITPRASCYPSDAHAVASSSPLRSPSRAAPTPAPIPWCGVQTAATKPASHDDLPIRRPRSRNAPAGSPTQPSRAARTGSLRPFALPSRAQGGGRGALRAVDVACVPEPQPGEAVAGESSSRKTVGGTP